MIKLLVNLFVFLLSTRGEDESGLELRALVTFVLLLVQCLPGPTTRKTKGRGETQMKGQREKWVVATDGEKMRGRGQRDRKHKGEKKGKKKEDEKMAQGSAKRYLHTVSVC